MKYLILTSVIRKTSVLAYFSLFSFCVTSQNTNYSPYSRFGTGEYNIGRTIVSSSMGNTAIGIRNNTWINSVNPASYSAFDSLSFTFDVALSLKINNISNSSESALYSNPNIQYFTAGLPVTRWWRMAFGLQPYSMAGYNILSNQTLNDSTTAKHTYTGQGGLNQFFLGHSFKLFPNLSFGFNTSFIFGSIDRTTISSFNELDYSSEYRNKRSIIMQDFHLNLGLQYTKQLKNDNIFCAGIVFENKTSMNSKVSNFTLKYLNISGVLSLDTIEDSVTSGQAIDLPLHAGIGFSYSKPNHMIIAFDVRYFNRENLSFLGVKDSQSNSLFAGFGYEYIPQYNSPNKYWKRMAYRAGAHYYSTGIELRNTAINQIGISFGLGFPLKRTKTMINLAFEAGTRGTLKNELIKEQYFVISAGLLLHDKWFVKPKYE